MKDYRQVIREKRIERGMNQVQLAKAAGISQPYVHEIELGKNCLLYTSEGCMPQTRFVLKKALGLGKKPVVVVNKIDRPGARPLEVVDEVLDLFIELGADDDQLEFPVIYASGRDGYATLDPAVPGTNMVPLFEEILKHVPAPEGDPDGPLQILFSSIEADDYVCLLYTS